MKRMLWLGILLILAGRVCGQSGVGALVIRGGTPPELKATAVEAVHKEQQFVGMCNEAACGLSRERADQTVYRQHPQKH